MSTVRIATVSAALFLLVVSGCGGCTENGPKGVNPCEGVELAQPDKGSACVQSSECADHFECVPLKEDRSLKCCKWTSRQCETEADCCAGQKCTDKKVCVDSVHLCHNDAACLAGAKCEAHVASKGPGKPPEAPEMRCRYQACGPLGECPSGLSCFQGECVGSLPCKDGCAPGSACVPITGECQQFACPASCAPGFIATFKNNRDIWDGCHRPSTACVCAELPGIQSNDLGRHSAIAANPADGAVWVSGYDGQYGDLVAFRYDGNGQLTHTEYVDGVPDGTPTWGRSGARGGVTDPGDDVGRYTDITVSEGRVYVSYYDVTRGDLRLAVRGTDGIWKRTTVDGATADLGLYSSISVDSDGLVGISYYQRGGSSSFNVSSCPGAAPTGPKERISAVKLARAKVKVPGSPSDFSVSTIACQSRPPPPCENCNGVCANGDSGVACLTPATGCTSCVGTDACVSIGGKATCAKKVVPSNLQEIDEGIGLFSSVAFVGKEAHVVFQRRKASDGDLLVATVSAAGAVTPPIVVDASGDTGYAPDIKVNPATKALAVSYHDHTTHSLKFVSAARLSSTLSPEVVDSGGRAPGSGSVSWVGGDSAVAFSPDGERVFIVYQDATDGDLKLSTRRNNWESLAPLRTEGAVGFFADAAFLGDVLFASHGKLRVIEVGETRVANTLHVEKYPR